MSEFSFEFIEHIAELRRADWDRLVGEGSPFLEYGFLRALEESGCVGGDSGWIPHLLVARRAGGTLAESGPKDAESELDEGIVGALPIYLKMHSMGEFVFDWGWADAAERAGIRYYPKAVIAAPLTPIQGRRILVDARLEAARAARLKREMLEYTLAFCERAGLSSLHINFVHPDELALLESLGLSIRTGVQFHWHNRRAPDNPAQYKDFGEFLARFRAKKRANIRRERRKLREAGISTEIRQGEELGARELDQVFDYYLDTIQKLAWGRQYLNRRFFQELGERLPNRLHAVFALEAGERFAGAFNLYKNEGLYGRYWGCNREVSFAHFEACIYRPVQWCIERGVQVFQPGAQGGHKYERGFWPTPTYSAHWVRHPGLRGAVEDFIAHERAAVDEQIAQLSRESPIAPKL